MSAMPGSSNARRRPAKAEIGAHGDRPGSIPKQLVLRPVDHVVVRSLIEKRHYLHSWPASVVLALGVFLRDDLVGAAVFTVASKNGHRIVTASAPSDVVTLARLYLVDELPANSESRVVAMALRYLRNHSRWKVVISYADPMAGHSGTIYQASGWLYVGLSDTTSYIQLPDGRLHHPRTVHTTFGSSCVRHLRATGIDARRVGMPGKHKYVYVLRESWRWRLKARPQPYPRQNGRGPP
jgi:hypothetical protein